MKILFIQIETNANKNSILHKKKAVKTTFFNLTC